MAVDNSVLGGKSIFDIAFDSVVAVLEAVPAMAGAAVGAVGATLDITDKALGAAANATALPDSSTMTLVAGAPAGTKDFAALLGGEKFNLGQSVNAPDVAETGQLSVAAFFGQVPERDRALTA